MSNYSKYSRIYLEQEDQISLSKSEFEIIIFQNKWHFRDLEPINTAPGGETQAVVYCYTRDPRQMGVQPEYISSSACIHSFFLNSFVLSTFLFILRSFRSQSKMINELSLGPEQSSRDFYPLSQQNKCSCRLSFHLPPCSSVREMAIQP